MARKRSSAARQRWISEKIRKLIHEGYEQDQAVAIAYSMARRRAKKRRRR